jgi:putative FmdB family regulatory protein
LAAFCGLSWLSTAPAARLPSILGVIAMPIYEFECENCGSRFEELVASGTEHHPCPGCEFAHTRRLLSPVSPPDHRPRGPKVRDSESRRREREAGRRERIADARERRS